ncbi:centromere-binding protein 1-like [Spinacia oleracea]|uniref:Centromere-binding protein 1-like n=1 Tax=Spinacia oleracea TaxID=3562 RepID=A0ABM3QRP9_SPIOL|nr:centromere-binding protein 1-like [Spinacia oleracea]
MVVLSFKDCLIPQSDGKDCPRTAKPPCRDTRTTNHTELGGKDSVAKKDPSASSSHRQISDNAYINVDGGFVELDDSVEDKVLPKEKEREANKYPREALEQFQDPVQHTVQQTVVDEDPVQHTVHQTVVDEDPVFVTFQSVHVQQLVFESCEFLHGNIVAAEQDPENDNEEDDEDDVVNDEFVDGKPGDQGKRGDDDDDENQGDGPKGGTAGPAAGQAEGEDNTGGAGQGDDHGAGHGSNPEDEDGAGELPPPVSDGTEDCKAGAGQKTKTKAARPKPSSKPRTATKRSRKPT